MLASCDEAEARNLLLYAGHCPSVIASIHDAFRCAGLPLDQGVNDGRRAYLREYSLH
jgi:hypothetical protein